MKTNDALNCDCELSETKYIVHMQWHYLQLHRGIYVGLIQLLPVSPEVLQVIDNPKANDLHFYSNEMFQILSVAVHTELQSP